MLTISQKNSGPYGDLWMTEIDDEWDWVFGILPYRLHEDFRHSHGPNLQRQSDLDLQAMPIYLCRVPSVAFFPYITYFAGTWFTREPTFIVPKTPLNRQDGRNWLRTLAKWPPHLVATNEEKARLAWIDDNDHLLTKGVEYREVMNLASAAESYLLDEIRYIYDESKSVFDGSKTETASRHCFSEKIAQPDITKAYLEWYVGQYNSFFTKVLKIGQQDDKKQRRLCITSGWTISRLATDAITMLSVDAPFVRKWQFFGFLDALASLINLHTKGVSDQNTDASTANGILELSFYHTEMLPTLLQIPIEPLREELINHTKNIYDVIDKMKITVTYEEKNTKTNILEQKTKTLTGSRLLRAYRNARHGYTLKPAEQEALFQHSGVISDDLPDLVIALWHYLLVKFPFS